MHIDPHTLARELKAKAIELGFEACGISVATELSEEKSRLEEWLNRGYHGSMEWMTGHFDKRSDPRDLVEGAKSVVSVLHSYYHPHDGSTEHETGRISRYAWGDDYNLVIKEKLFELLGWLNERTDGAQGRAFVDSAPVMDKAWAARSGLGWIGKHSNLISPDHGSWCFIGEIIVDVELPGDRPIADHCGTCTKCIDACPTGAIVQPYVVNGEACISYSTIEHKGDDIPDSLASKHGNWIFGCDVCQDVCPWNKFKTESRESRYAPREGMLDTPLLDWATISQSQFSEQFRKNAVKRTKLAGLERNIRYALKNAELSGENPDPDSDE